MTPREYRAHLLINAHAFRELGAPSVTESLVRMAAGIDVPASPLLFREHENRGGDRHESHDQTGEFKRDAEAKEQSEQNEEHRQEYLPNGHAHNATHKPAAHKLSPESRQSDHT